MINVNKVRLVGLETVDLPISVAHPADPYILRSAEGLGPSAVPIFISGPEIHKGDPELKELTLRVELNPDFRQNQTSATLRARLYGMLTPQDRDSVWVQLMQNDVVVAQVEGYVTRIDPVLFSKEPEVSIVIQCNDAYFSAPEARSVKPDTKSSFVIENIGSAPTPFEMEIIFKSNIGGWRLTDAAGKFVGALYQFQSGDVLRVTTTPFSRKMEVYRGGIPRNLLHVMNPNSKWLYLRGKNNRFTALHPDTWEWNYFRYTPRYWGI